MLARGYGGEEVDQTTRCAEKHNHLAKCTYKLEYNVDIPGNDVEDLKREGANISAHYLIGENGDPRQSLCEPGMPGAPGASSGHQCRPMNAAAFLSVSRRPFWILHNPELCDLALFRLEEEGVVMGVVSPAPKYLVGLLQGLLEIRPGLLLGEPVAAISA